jgi:hypothetical protein
MSAAENGWTPQVVQGGDDALNNGGVADRQQFEQAATGEGFHPVVISEDVTLRSKADVVDFVRGRTRRVDFTDVIQHGRADPDYSLVFGERSINVGDDLTSRAAVAKRLGPHGIPLGHFTPKAWGEVYMCLVTLGYANVEDHDDGAEEAREWLAAYYGERGGHNKTVSIVGERAPFTSEGLHYLNRNHFVQWVQRSMAKVPADDIKRRLDRLGFTNAGMVNVSGEALERGRPVTARASNRYYVGPRNLLLPGRQNIPSEQED